MVLFFLNITHRVCDIDNGGRTRGTEADARVEAGMGGDPFGHTERNETTDGTKDFFGDLTIRKRAKKSAGGQVVGAGKIGTRKGIREINDDVEIALVVFPDPVMWRAMLTD